MLENKNIKISHLDAAKKLQEAKQLLFNLLFGRVNYPTSSQLYRAFDNLDLRTKMVFDAIFEDHSVVVEYALLNTLIKPTIEDDNSDNNWKVRDSICEIITQCMSYIDKFLGILELCTYIHKNDDLEHTELKNICYSKDIFIVHGHDHKLRDQVKSLLSEWGYNPIVLEDMPNQMCSVMEKIEQYSNVGYAVVLLTGCDEGKAIGDHNSVLKRPRQNVIFELGYFIGKITRNRVTIVKTDAQDIPSDIVGSSYISAHKDEKWKNKLKANIDLAYK